MKLAWSWSVFLEGYCNGFCRMMAGSTVAVLVVSVFADTSSASFSSAQIGLVFLVGISALYGASAGDSAVRDWRERQGGHQDARTPE